MGLGKTRLSRYVWYMHQALQFLSQAICTQRTRRTQVIVGSMNMGYISDTARNRTHNLFRPKRESIPLGHSDGHVTSCPVMSRHVISCYVISRRKSRDGHATNASLSTDFFHTQSIQIKHDRVRWLSRRLPIQYRISGI